MASNNGKWETVVNKKKSHITKSDVKKAQQKFIQGDNVPKVEQRDPIKLDETVYSAGFESSRFKDENETDDEKYPSRLPYDSKDSTTKTPRSQKRKEKKAHKQAPSFDMDGKIKKLDCVALKNQIKEIENKFPGQHLIWLKDIATWLNSQLTGPSEKGDIAYLTKKADYPMCELTEEARNILLKLIRRCDTKTLEAYFVSLVALLTGEVQQGHATVSYRILIQLLASVQQNIFVDSCNEIVHGKSRNGDSYLAVIWAFSQVNSSLKNGLAVWWSAMYSVLDKKHHGAAAIHYLDKLLKMFVNKSVDKPLIITDQMVQMIEIMVAEKSPLQHTPSLMDVMRGHFAMLERMLLTDKKENHAENVFSQLLLVLRQHEDVNVKYMICKILVECLCSSSKCFDWWNDNLLRHMRESSVLLKHIQTEKSDVARKLAACHKYGRGDVLYKNAVVMLESLERANEKGRFEKKAGYKECRKVCAAFIRERTNEKKKSSRLWTFIKYLLLAVVIVSAVDIYKSGSYSDSRTSFYMKKHGVEDVCLKGLRIVKNVPNKLGISTCCFDPILSKTSEYVTKSGRFVYERTTPLREYLNQVLPPVFEKVGFFFQEQYRIISGLLIDNYEHYSPTVKQNFQSTYQWFHINVPLTYNYLQNVSVAASNSIYQLNPQMFDTMKLAISDTVSYAMKTTPVIIEVSSNYTTVFLNTVQKYVSDGQLWLQQYVANASPTAAK